MPQPIAACIDHTLLRPDATAGEIDALCREALEHRFASVCVNPCHVARCARQLTGSEVAVCTVIGFPLGASATAVKAFEAARAVADGAGEVDMVINIGALKAGDTAYVQADIGAVVEAAGGRTVKVILECCLLSDGEKRVAVRLARAAGAHFVKTSTGFSTGGATEHDVALMASEVGDAMGVKASGGIRDLAAARRMLSAGATRLGTSAGVAIARQASEDNMG